MELVKVELAVPKDSKEVLDLLVGLAKLVKGKADAAEYLKLIPELQKAYEGYEAIPAEVKSEHKGDLAGYFAKSALDLF